MNRTAQLDARDRLGRALHGHARQPRRHQRAREHPRGPRCIARAAGVDGQRVHAQLRGLPADRRRARRPARPAAVFAFGIGVFTVASAAAALAPSTDALIAARALAGPRRRGHHAADADAAERGVPGRAARAGARHLVAASPASASRSARWSAARSSRASPGTGSSGSTCRSGCCWRRRPCACCARASAPTPARPARRGAGQRRPARARVRDRARAVAGLDERDCARLAHASGS